MKRMQLLPPRPGACPECARYPAHKPHEPHDRNSLYYQTKFNMEHGFAPTWQDAMAHCTLEVQVKWERELRARGAWDA